MDSVTAIVVTRGDVDMQPVLDSLPVEWEVLVWDNGEKACYREPPPNRYWNGADLSVYGRYAAIEYASHDLIYVQDDDVIVSDPQAIVDAWLRYSEVVENDDPNDDPCEHVVANMPEEFRPHYPDSALVGFGACFHRSLPETVFDRWRLAGADNWVDAPTFRRCCDVVLTTLAPRVLVDVPKENREMASDPNRMWKQPGHVSERATVLNLARSVRDA